MKHIELSYPSLAEAYAHAREMLNISDLGHRAHITIDIDLDSPWDGKFIHIPDSTEDVK